LANIFSPAQAVSHRVWCKRQLQARVLNGSISIARRIFLKASGHLYDSAYFFTMTGIINQIRNGVLGPVGPVGAGDRTILLDSLAIMLAIIIPVIIATLLCAWWFRASNTRAKYLPDWEYSGQVELVVWSIPLMVVLFLGGIGWIGSHQLDPHFPLKSKEKPLRVEVVSLDWKWLFIYPDQGVASVNQLAIPVGVPVEFSLTSASVMNSFFVPRLGSQIYAMAGMVTHINLEADKPGTYTGFSAQFSGDGFSGMNFKTMAVSPDEFARWVATAKSAKADLDEAAYAKLVEPTQINPVVFYRSASPDLFKKIVQLSAPGTDTGAMSDPSDIPAGAPPAAGEKE
jgi:cytochrome o ubiquinol oxidase subunit 2